MAETIRCPQCQAQLTRENLFDLAACPSCAAKVQITVFQAWFRTSAPAPIPQTIILEGESSCFYHPQKRAVVPCDSCGRFLCALCDLEIQGQHLCPACVSAGRRRGRVAELENRRTLYDNLAFTVALVSLFFGPFALLGAPAAIFIAIRYWNHPSSIVPRTKIRAIMAVLLSLALIAGWSYWMFNVLAGTIQLRMGSTGNLPVSCGNLPHGMGGGSSTPKSIGTSDGSGELVARQDGPVARVTLRQLNRLGDARAPENKLNRSCLANGNV